MSKFLLSLGLSFEGSPPAISALAVVSSYNFLASGSISPPSGWVIVKNFILSLYSSLTLLTASIALWPTAS